MKPRRYREEDLAALKRLGVMAFGASESYWEDYFDPGKSPRLDPDLVYVIEADGEARATATVLDMEVFVDGRARPMGGVAAVACHPAYRRRGYAGELMRACLAAMRGRGVRLSMLHPFAHPFYRAFGYEVASDELAYTMSPRDLPTSREQRRVRAYAEDDLPGMMDLLEGRASRRSCCPRRGEGRWRQYLARDDGEAVVYEARGGIEGYLLYRQLSGNGEPPRALEVSEVVAGTLAAREALISFAAAYDPHDYKVSLYTPPDEPLHPFLRDSADIKARLRPVLMLRLVDVEGALGFLDRNADPLVLEISDDTIPENAREYTVGGGEVVRGAEAGERVSLDVRQLAQLYAGYLTVSQLDRHGLLRPGSPRALRLLDELFPAGNPYAYPPDHF